jgi:ketosteroid isomerase-like protein
MLNPSPEFVVRAYFEAWGRSAIDEALAWLSEDIHWTLYLGTNIVPFGGTELAPEICTGA